MSVSCTLSRKRTSGDRLPRPSCESPCSGVAGEPTVTLLVSLGSTQEHWGGLPGLRPALRPGLRPAMAVRDAQKTSEEERCVTFSLGDELFRYQANGESPCTFGLPWAPPSEKIFDLHFFWQLWSNLAKAAMRKDVPLVSLRNMSYMLNDTYKIPRALDVNFFGQLSKPLVGK